MSVATSSSSLREQRSVHPTVAHTVDSLLLQERTKWAIHIHDGLTQSVTIFTLLEMPKRGEATWERSDLFGPIRISRQSLVASHVTDDNNYFITDKGLA